MTTEIATRSDGDALTAELISGGGPAHGTVLLNSDGSFTYTPDAGYSGLVSFQYGAPIEPSHSAWRQYVWLNRPCCLLHVVVMWAPTGWRFVPAGARPARLGGRSGLLRPARGYGLGSASTWPQTFFWANHVWFAWRQGGRLLRGVRGLP